MLHETLGTMHRAVLFKKASDNNTVQCTACSHYCAIPENKTGICGVRKNVNGTLFLIVYGKPVALHIDPIEKKPLYHFYPGEKVLSLGTFGCNFRCDFCQNYEMSQMKDEDRSGNKVDYFSEQLEDWSPGRIVQYAQEKNIPMISYTYNEPAIFVEYAHDIMLLAHENNIKNVYVSNGYESREALEYVGPYLDAANIDLKSFRDEFYRKLCGGKLMPVFETIKNLYERGVWLEITTLVIPGENDSDEELQQIAEFIAGIDKNIPWHISRFFPTYKMMDKEITSYASLERAREIGKAVGLKYVYVGNVM